MSQINYALELNEEQLKVVLEADGHCLVLAGAGSGKTRTLVYRVAYLLEHNVPAENIMLVTFTNKAAREMLERIQALLGDKTRALWGGTFHHLGNRLLRRYSEAVNYTHNFVILDQDDSHHLIKNVLAELNIRADKSFPKPDVIKDIISFAYNSQMTIEDVVLNRYRHLQSDIITTLQIINQSYQQKKRDMNLMDFDDLLCHWYLLLRNPSFGQKISSQFKYVLVDEYQDTNKIQGAIVNLLADVNKNLLVVGDDAQSIYSFRAATVSNILDFPKIFPSAKLFKLETNYRSTPDILKLANASISNNIEQYRKELKSVKKGANKPVMTAASDNYQQAELVLDKVIELRNRGYALKDIAILSRSTFQNIELELEINKRRIPYEVRGGMRFFEQAHIKDVLAYLRIFVNPSDELAWKRALGLQSGIGIVMANKIWQTITSLGKDVNVIIEALKNVVMPGRVDDGLRTFLGILRKIAIAETVPAKIAVIMGDFYDQYLKNCYEDAQSRKDDLDSLINFSAKYEDLESFLSESALTEGFKGEKTAINKERPTDVLVVSTIHQAKGLEWKAVFVIGLADGQFPHYRVFERPDELSEERRLFYVAVTRAQDDLFLFYPVMGMMNGMSKVNRASMFLSELDEDLFDKPAVAGTSIDAIQTMSILDRVRQSNQNKGDWNDDPDSRVIEY